jgi:geranylgeranyl diphosphate synthase type II
MLTFSDCQKIIEDQINNLEISQKRPGNLYEPIQYILSLGGKRVRPVATLMACNLFSDNINPAIKSAIAIEVFHNFTLVHDDIMDNASLRRNHLTIHSKWGNNVGILSGDAMQILAYQLICDNDPEFLKPILDLFNTTALEVCEGQQYDMNFALRNNVSLQEYMRMIELKTSVLLAASFKIGAICGEAPASEAQKIYEFGRNLGLAFQIQDDYLDVYADQGVFGKTVGGDIAENKKTFLFIKALELAKGEHANLLKRAFNNEISDITEKIESVRKVYDELNIPQITNDKIAEYSNKAFENLDSVIIDNNRKQPLRGLAQDLTNRKK